MSILIPGVASLNAFVGSAFDSAPNLLLSFALSVNSILFEPLLRRELVEAWLMEDTARGRSAPGLSAPYGRGETGGESVAMLDIVFCERVKRLYNNCAVTTKD